VSTWILTVVRPSGNVSKSLAEWGIENPQVSFRSLTTDEFTFQMPSADVVSTPEFAYGETISLTFGGVQKFRGKVTRLPVTVRGGKNAEESVGYVVSGPWHDLARLNYIQPRQIANVTGVSIIDYSAVDTSQVTFGAQATTGDLIPFGEQIEDIVAFAVRFSVDLQEGDIPAFRTIPIDVGRDITCAESIKRCLSYQPDAVAWFDYSTTPPSLNIKARSTLTAVDLDFTGSSLIQACTITPRLDLVPAGVLFNFLTTMEATETVGPNTIPRTIDVVTPQSSGSAFGIGVLVATIELTRTSEGVYEDVPSGLAAYYYNQLSVPHYEGTLRLKGADVPFTAGMGNVFNFTNGQTAWATMNALVQTVTFDLFSGTADLDFGPPTIFPRKIS
jgi:hypothetical protein